MNRKGTVCVVDADRELHSILTGAFGLDGYRVVSASRARDALAKIQLQKFAAIFLDPDGEAMDEVLRLATTADNLNSKTPIVIMMSNPETQIPPEVVPRVVAVVAKPFTVDEIVGALRRTLV